MSLAWSGSTAGVGLSGTLASAIWAEAPRDTPHAPAHRKRQRSEVLENRLIDLVRCRPPNKGNPAVPKITGESTRRPSPGGLLSFRSAAEESAVALLLVIL